MKDLVRTSLSEARSCIDWLAQDEPVSLIEQFAAEALDCFARNGRILTCGNGGSMCDAMHFAEELSGRYRKDRPALAAQSISDPSHLSCVANDFGFDAVFARGVEAWGNPGDLLICFSTSGNSPNVVRAAETARGNQMVVLGLLGKDGGRTLGLCDAAIVVPGETSDRIQEVHIKVVHIVIELIERTLFPENYR